MAAPTARPDPLGRTAPGVRGPYAAAPVPRAGPLTASAPPPAPSHGAAYAGDGAAARRRVRLGALILPAALVLLVGVVAAVVTGWADLRDQARRTGPGPAAGAPSARDAGSGPPSGPGPAATAGSGRLDGTSPERLRARLRQLGWQVVEERAKVMEGRYHLQIYFPVRNAAGQQLEINLVRFPTENSAVETERAFVPNPAVAMRRERNTVLFVVVRAGDRRRAEALADQLLK